jgi:hypothetical protein
LIGQPVVYLATSPEHARAIRASQERLCEVTGAALLFRVEYPGEVFVDRHVQPLGAAWLVYADLPPDSIQVCY